jgi:hypothetical protein
VLRDETPRLSGVRYTRITLPRLEEAS